MSQIDDAGAGRRTSPPRIRWTAQLRQVPTRSSLRSRLTEATARPPEERLIWTLGLGALGLAWPTATVAAYLPSVLSEFTTSDAIIGLILATEGVFALKRLRSSSAR